MSGAARPELVEPRPEGSNVSERGAIEEDVGFLACWIGARRGFLVSFLAVVVDLMAGGLKRDNGKNEHLGKRDAWVFVAWG